MVTVFFTAHFTFPADLAVRSGQFVLFWDKAPKGRQENHLAVPLDLSICDANSAASMGQAGAALGAAAGEDLPAVGSSHPLAETVLLGALALLGLIGTEHLHTPPTFLCCGAKRPRYSTAGGQDVPPRS